MEINITALKNVNFWPIVGSVHTHGTNAGTDTFKAAQDVEIDVLDTPKKIKAVRSHLQDMGMDETNKMTKKELNAIFMQMVALELRDNGLTNLDELEDAEDFEGNIYVGVDNELYYYVGS